MKKAITLTILFALVFAVIPAAASTPLAVTIDSTMDTDTGTGTFVAYGPAVDAGLFCRSGTASDYVPLATGWQSNIRVNLRVFKTLVCDDGSGEIFMDIKVRIVYSASETLSNWVIKNGDGEYTRLHGEGQITATGADNLVFDHYTGLMHQD